MVGALRAPAEDGAGPGHTPAEPGQEEMVALVHPPLGQGVVQGQRDGGRGRVAVAVDDRDGPLLGDAQPLAHRLDDAQVGLVGHEQGDVVGAEAGVGHGLLGGFDDRADGLAEDLLAVHGEEAAVLALEQVAQRSVGVEVPAEQLSGAVDRLDDDGAGAVAHDHRQERSSQSVIFERVSDPMSRMGPEPAAINPATVTTP